MMSSTAYDAVVIGSGPNGLAAAIEIVRAGFSALILEGRSTIGGGTRTAELTLPGFFHDVCSAIHPLARDSSFFRSLPLEEFGLEWIDSPACAAHALDDRRAVILYPSIEETAAQLGADGEAYRRTFQRQADDWSDVSQDVLGPLPLPPKHILKTLRFGWDAIRPAASFARRLFTQAEARALFGGMAAHAQVPLTRPGTAAAGLVLQTLAHTGRWPFPRGGSHQITRAMAAYFRSLGGEIRTDYWVRRWEDIPLARVVLFDTDPQQMATIAAGHLPDNYRLQLDRYRYGQGVFKIDYALSEPVPWKNREISLAATVHLGGTLEEITASEAAVWQGQHPERPFVLVAQPSLFDPTRAPSGMHTLWAYCHVPAASSDDMTARIDRQIERYAPGFQDCILARHTLNAVDMESYNPNYVGGDINVGAQDLDQVFTRPTLRLNPYTTPDPGIYLCSSATPPGGGVHGLCGYYAAQAALDFLKS
jgi:phytoene dehydrogenase-like protein